MAKTINGIPIPDDALVLDEGRVGIEAYVIWSVPFPKGWKGEPAVIIQISGKGGAILTKKNLQEMLRQLEP